MMARMSAFTPAPGGPPDGSGGPGGSDSGHLVHVLRPRGSVFLGIVAIVAASVMLAFSGGAGLAFIGAMALLATCSFVLLVRPHVRVSIEGAAVHNPFRRTFVPWRVLEDAGSRWNLELYAAERTIRVWAISNPMIRPRVGMSLGFGGIGAPRAPGDAAASADPFAKAKAEGALRHGATSAPAAARLIEAAREDWLEAVDEGIVAEPANPRIVARWDLWDIALVVVPAIFILVAVLT